MSAEIKVPQLGESVVEATVGRWLKSEGDMVGAGDALVELETDKVNVEVPATAGGTLRSIVKGEGETVAVGDVLALLDDGEGGQASDNGAQARSISRAVSSASSAAESVATSQASHADVDGDTIADDDLARATPLARRIASEHGIDLNAIKGSGPGGRVKRADVAAYLEGRPGAGVESKAPAVEVVSPPARVPVPQQLVSSAMPYLDPGGGRWEERIPMSRRRLTIARRLVEAQHTAAMLTTFNEVDMTAITELRRRHRDAFKERYGVGLGFMSFFTRAVVGGLKEFPRLNAEIQGEEMVLKHYYDIGIAVGVEEGLVVPVLRDADRLSFGEIERQIADLADKARRNALSLAELQGGTFTITNGGVFGSLLSTPILNTPQVGILGMHKIQERPIAVDGEVVIRPMMYLAMSYDHRIVDGSEAVRFLVRVKELLEDSEVLLLEG